MKIGGGGACHREISKSSFKFCIANLKNYTYHPRYFMDVPMSYY